MCVYCTHTSCAIRKVHDPSYLLFLSYFLLTLLLYFLFFTFPSAPYQIFFLYIFLNFVAIFILSSKNNTTRIRVCIKYNSLFLDELQADMLLEYSKAAVSSATAFPVVYYPTTGRMDKHQNNWPNIRLNFVTRNFSIPFSSKYSIQY